jgi:hypothetical protein
MNENKQQELCARFVAREVFYCASMLMYSIGKNIEGAAKLLDEDYDTLFNLFQRRNYENPGTTFVGDDAGFGDLEIIADQFGSWSDVLYGIFGELKDDAEFDLEDAAESNKAVHTALRAAVVELVDDWSWVCSKFDLDDEYYEVYEHWIVSPWLAAQLEENGEAVGEFAGLTIWGRCTTGQSISMDSVIEEIVRTLWAEEWEAAK